MSETQQPVSSISPLGRVKPIQKRLLLIDTDKSLGCLRATALENAGFEVTSVLVGDHDEGHHFTHEVDALEEFETAFDGKTYDGIVTRFNLPLDDVNHFNAANLLRRYNIGNKPVIIFSDESRERIETQQSANAFEGHVDILDVDPDNLKALQDRAQALFGAQAPDLPPL